MILTILAFCLLVATFLLSVANWQMLGELVERKRKDKDKCTTTICQTNEKP